MNDHDNDNDDDNDDDDNDERRVLNSDRSDHPCLEKADFPSSTTPVLLH